MKIIEKIERYLSEGTEDIKAEHEGLLQVPPGKKVTDLGADHFIALAQKIGRAKVIHGLMNLYRWNKGKEGNKGELADWAKSMQEKVSAALDKNLKQKNK
jgi:hypothetical protein